MLIQLLIFKYGYSNINSFIPQLLTEYKDTWQALTKYDDMIVNKRQYGLGAGIAYLQVEMMDIEKIVILMNT